MRQSKNPASLNQIGASISITIIAIWGIWVLWWHTIKPQGIEHIEILFLIAIVPIYLVLIPLYWFRIRWSYISGILVLLGLFAGLIKSVIDKTFFFSVSVYNFITIVVLIIALLCIYFSIRSFLELPSVGKVKSIFGIVGLIIVSAVLVVFVSINETTIENFKLRKIIQGVQSRTNYIDNFEDRISALMEEGDLPSLVAAIVVNGKIVWSKGFGEQDNLDKIFDIGSITKTFIATSVLQLYEQGKIDLDNDINNYLPFSIRHPNYPDIPITFRMLLTNRSGMAHTNEFYRTYFAGPELRQWGVSKRGWDYSEEFETLSYKDFIIEYLQPEGKYFQPDNWIDAIPGTKYNYSTPGFDLLGYLVETVSGQTIEEYMRFNIFIPLKMDDTTTTPLNNPEIIATPYERWYGVLSKSNIELPLNQRLRIGGGGIYTTADDLSNFLIAQMNEGSFEDHQLLKPETINLMHSKISNTSNDFLQVGYGYGWGIFQDEPRQMWDITFQPRGIQGHGGRYFGYSSAMYMAEEEQGAYGYIMLANHSMVESFDGPWVFAIQNNIQDLILQEAYEMYKDSIK
ncbi:serine hydrolase domain-containing protein [Actinomycetota bacterium]